MCKITGHGWAAAHMNTVGITVCTRSVQVQTRPNPSMLWSYEQLLVHRIKRSVFSVRLSPDKADPDPVEGHTPKNIWAEEVWWG